MINPYKFMTHKNGKNGDGGSYCFTDFVWQYNITQWMS